MYCCVPGSVYVCGAGFKNRDRRFQQQIALLFCYLIIFMRTCSTLCGVVDMGCVSLCFWFPVTQPNPHLDPHSNPIQSVYRIIPGGVACVGCTCLVISFILDVRLVDLPARVTQEEGHTGLFLHVPPAVCVFSSHPFWTSMDVPAGVTQEEGHTGFLIHLLSAVHALIFLSRRIQPFLSLVDREVEFCVLTILIVLHPLGIFSLVF